MSNADRVIVSGVEMPIHVTLPDGAVDHQGTAIVEDGHLFLRGSPQFSDCPTYAVYAPGRWLSAVVDKDLKKEVQNG
ncbi:hypothetical protein [Rhodoferax ferrireducens]|uniref:hypothetical protein n=1 Tax=Rhodoferax ferrireducens TaxID=192843 RepID=UPI00140FAA6F|nr:hypothetical protein [Rhodoferax ferrireducens]